MDCELVRLAGVPIGLVTSALFYSTDIGSSGREDQEGPSEQAREVQIAVCPTGRLIAFIASFKAQFVACTDQLQLPVLVGGDAPTSGAAYQTSYEGLLKVVRDPNTPRPIATAVVVVPVALESKKELSSIVLVGFSDGCIRAYSKKGAVLFVQQLHGEPVVQIHCMAPSGDLQNDPTHFKVNVLVVFSTLVCVIEGWSLCAAVAHAVETRDRSPLDDEEEEEREEGAAPVISYQKWRLGDQGKTADAALLAPSFPSLYDYLCEAGNVGGYDTTVKGSPAPQSRLIVVGESPMVSLYKISKDVGTVNVSEVVSAVASKMTRSVLGKLSQAGGWLGWRGGGGGPPSRPRQPLEKKMIMNLPMSTNIPDERRSVGSISVSPLGDLSVCVDGFGRVLLLDNHSMTIGRMWKGYRDAQTGWLLVQESSSSSSSTGGGGASLRRKRGRSPSSDAAGRDGRSRERRGRRAQCLCLYLPHRGLLELWPVQNGSRIAVFQVGKGCRLLMAPHGAVTPSKDPSDDRSGWSKGCGLRDSAVLLCPNGHLLTFLVPFPTLARLNDAKLHDDHLLQKLSPALQSGDCEGLLQIITTLKTTQSLRDAVERVVYSYPVSSLPRHYPVTVINTALTRTNPTDPAHRAVRDYLTAVRQLLRLHLTLGHLSTQQPSPLTPHTSTLSQMLVELCGLSEVSAEEISKSLQIYLSSKPAKLHTHVLRALSLKDLLRCFDLPGRVGRGELCEGVEGGMARGCGQDEVVRLTLKRGIGDTSLSDLSFALFHVLLTHSVAEKSVQSVLVGSGIPPSILLTLLCQVFLSGRVIPPAAGRGGGGGGGGGNARQLLHRLHLILQTITTAGGGREGLSEALSEVRVQCSHTHNAGHALLLVLVCQKLASEWNRDDAGEISEVVEGEGWGEGDWGGGEGWETVTEEGEQWVTLQVRLEVLTSLCGVVGLTGVSKTPPLPLLRRNGTEESANEKSGVTVARLEEEGPWLIANCVALWLVGQKVSPHTIGTLTGHGVPEGGEVVEKMVPLVRVFGLTLSNCSLLTHCAWQAAHLWHYHPAKYPELHEQVLEFVSLIPRPRILAGTCLFLWHTIFEISLVDVMDLLKRGLQQKPGALELASLTRRLFTYLYQLAEEGGRGDEATEETQTLQDAIQIPTPKDKHFLMDAAPTLPLPPPVLLRAYLSLLLHTELALLFDSAHHVASFYPSWVRTVVKKGLLRWREVGRIHDAPPTPPQLQHKRIKFLCEAVVRYLDTHAPKLRPSIPSPTLNSLPAETTSSRPRLEVTEVMSALFLLGELWEVEVDTVRRHFVSSLFAAGLGDRGTEAFQSVSDKSGAAKTLLSLSGSLTDSLLQKMTNKAERLALTAHLPPSQLEWVRKQSSSGVTSGCPRVSPTWTSLSQLLSLIQPHLHPSPSSPSSASDTIAQTLANIASLQTP